MMKKKENFCVIPKIYDGHIAFWNDIFLGHDLTSSKYTIQSDFKLVHDS